MLRRGAGGGTSSSQAPHPSLLRGRKSSLAALLVLSPSNPLHWALMGAPVLVPPCGKCKGPDTLLSIRAFGAGGGTRTHTVSPPTDFESVTSTIPSHRQKTFVLYPIFFKISRVYFKPHKNIFLPGFSFVFLFLHCQTLYHSSAALFNKKHLEF